VTRGPAAPGADALMVRLAARAWLGWEAVAAVVR